MLRDLRFAFHLLLKERWYSAVAIVALALGIGVNATVFTLVNAILIRGLPYQDSAYLYMLGSQDKDGNQNSVSALDFQDWRAQSKAFEGLAAFSNNGVNVSDDRSAPQSARSASLTSNAFSLLVMKLHACRDRLDDADRQLGRHHALDVYRVLAMLSEPEERLVRQLRHEHRADASVRRAAELAAELFADVTSRGALRMREHALASANMQVERALELLGDLLRDAA